MRDRRGRGGELPGAGGGVDGGRPPLAAPLVGVVRAVARQQGEDEVGGLGAEVGLALGLARPLHLSELQVVHTWGGAEWRGEGGAVL